MHCKKCLGVLGAIGEGFNSALGTDSILERTGRALVERLRLKACHFLLLSRDRGLLEHVSSFGLREGFLAKGAVQAEKSVLEALQGEIVTISDCGSDPRLHSPADHAEEGLASALIAPLKAQDQVIGVVRLFAGEKREFSALELEVTEVLTAFCTRAIIHSQFQRIQSELRAAAHTSLDLDTVLESTARLISVRLQARGCSIHLVEGRDLRTRASAGLSHGFLDALAADAPTGMRMALEGCCSQLYDPLEGRRSSLLRRAAHEGIASILYVPMSTSGQVVGVLCLYTHRPYRFCSDETYFMRAIADQCMISVQHARIYDEVKQSYEALVDDFQLWFETGPPPGDAPTASPVVRPRSRDGLARASAESEL